MGIALATVGNAFFYDIVPQYTGKLSINNGKLMTAGEATSSEA